jgi:hypothetical protein
MTDGGQLENSGFNISCTLDSIELIPNVLTSLGNVQSSKVCGALPWEVIHPLSNG